MLVRDRDIEPVAERLDGDGAHLLLLMGDVLAFAGFTHAVALDRLGQNHGRLPLMLHRGRVGGVYLVRVVAAAVQAPDVVVGHVGHQLQQLGILAEEVLAHVGAVLRFEGLVFAVHRLFHAFQQQAVLVLRQQRIPVAAPDHLDHVPAGAAEICLQLLDDLAVAAHRPVEPLQVAVDDEDEVVQPFARRQRNRSQRFGLVHLAVAHESPHLAPVRIEDAAIAQVLHEARLIDGRDRSQAHGHRGELPEIRHQPGMRI